MNPTVSAQMRRRRTAKIKGTIRSILDDNAKNRLSSEYAQENEHQLTCEVASASTLVRSLIERLREWIEEQIECSIDDAVVMKVPLEAGRLAANLIDTNREFPRSNDGLDYLRKLVTDVGFAPSHIPIFDLWDKCGPTLYGQPGGYGSYQPYSFQTRDCVISLRLGDLEQSIVAMQIAYRISEDERYFDFLVFPRRNATVLLKHLALATECSRLPRLCTLRGETRFVEPFCWDQLTLAADIREQLVRDFDRFFEERNWYQQMRIPHRRGYLLHGPPGNGKSSVIKAMLSSRGLTAYQMRLFDSTSDDNALEALFTKAALNGPSIVLLEDIDRAFPKSGNGRTEISLQALLNCLDGVGSGTGIITVATANEPTLLDPAILRRPGRFDRVVYFPNPEPALREQYFRSMHSSLGNLDRLVGRTRGYSYAQLRETFIMAALNARDAGKELHEADLVVAADLLRQGHKIRGPHRDAAGFATSDLALELAESSS